jgi:hypothetical protein
MIKEGHTRVSSIPGNVDVANVVVLRQAVEGEMTLQEAAVTLSLEHFLHHLY